MLLTVVACLLVGNANALLRTFDSILVGGASAPPYAIIVRQFGSVVGGRVEVDITSSGQVFVSYVRVALFDSWDHYSDSGGYCYAPAVAKWLVGSNATSLTAVVADVDQYMLLVHRCDEGIDAPIVVSGSVSLTNPGVLGHLSVEDGGLPTLYAYVAVVYACLVVVWAAALSSGLRQQQPPPPRVHWVHLAFGAAGVLKSIGAIASSVFWQQQAGSGQGAPQARAAGEALDAAATALFIGANLALASGLGWYAGRRTVALERREWTLLAALVGGYAGVGLLLAACVTGPDPSAVEQCSAFSTVLVILYSIGCVLITVLLNYQIGTLRYTLLEDEWTPTVPAAYTELGNYASLRLAFVWLLAALPVLLFMQATMINWSRAWLVLALHEVALCAGAVAVGCVIFPQTSSDVDVVVASVAEAEARREARRLLGSAVSESPTPRSPGGLLASSELRQRRQASDSSAGLLLAAGRE